MTLRAIAIAAVTILITLAAAGGAGAERKVDAVRVFYFGNSLTGSSLTALHDELGKSAGKQWTCDVFAGAGWQSWQHRNELWRTMGRPVDAATQTASGRGELTLDENLAQSAAFKPKALKKRSGNIRTAEFPDRDAFDYAAQWSKSYQGDFDKPWVGNICRTRDYTNQVFEGIKTNFPDLWKQRRLVCIPGGELFFELDKKMQAGKMPGLTTIKDFYTDVQHIRAGLASYSVAALFFAAIFEQRVRGTTAASGWGDPPSEVSGTWEEQWTILKRLKETP